MDAQQQLLLNSTGSTLMADCKPNNRLYISGREVYIIPKTLGEYIGEKWLHPAIHRISLISSVILEAPTHISSFSGRIFSFFSSLPQLPLFVEGATYAQDLSDSCMREDFLGFVDAEEEVMGTLSEEHLRRCGSIFSLSAEKSGLTSCFNTAYTACQERNWALLKQIQPLSNALINSEGRSLVWEAIHRKDYHLAEDLIYKKIALHIKDSAGNTLMHFAARIGKSALVMFLHQFIQIDAVNNDGQSPLHKAAEYGRDHIVSYLIDHGVSFKVHSKLAFGSILFERVTPIHLAVIYGQHEVIHAFFEHNLLESVEDQVSGIGHIMHLAIYFRNYPTLELLLTKFHTQVESLINIGNDQRVTPVMLAARMGDWRSLILLRQKGAYLKGKDNLGRTAVHWAVVGRQNNSLALLDHYECDLEATDNQGTTPIQLLGKNGKVADLEIANYLNGLILRRKNPHSPVYRRKSCYPEGLVFKGGGPKGIAYIGAVAELQELQCLDELLRVGGTSAGAITAALLALDCQLNEIEELLNEDLTKFLDHPFTEENIKERLNQVSINQLISIIGQLYAYYQNPLVAFAQDFLNTILAIWYSTGACEGEVFRKRMEGFISFKVANVVGGKQEDYAFTTFGELKKLIEQGFPFKHLYVVTTNIETGRVEEINSVDPTWANVIISDAIRASMSIPFVFVPHRLHCKNSEGKREICHSLGLHVDGGLLKNFPIELFDKKKYHPVGVHPGASKGEQEGQFINTRTLGLSLFSKEDRQPSAPRIIQTLGDLTWVLGEIYANAEKAFQGQVFQNSYRTIEINNEGVGLLDFHLSSQKKGALVKSGKDSVRQFFTDCPESVVKILKRHQSVHLQTVEKWSSKLKLLNEINSEALEWLVISTFFQPEEIPTAWIDRWFDEKDLLAKSKKGVLDLERAKNFLPPFNLLQTVQSNTLRQNILYHLMDLGFFYYKESTHSLILESSTSELIQTLVLADKIKVRNWVVAHFPRLKEVHPVKWVEQCHWISRHIAKTDLFQLRCHIYTS